MLDGTMLKDMPLAAAGCRGARQSYLHKREREASREGAQNPSPNAGGSHDQGNYGAARRDAGR